MLTRLNVLLVIFITVLSIARTAHAEGEGVRTEYDSLMKSSGKWDFISSSTLTLGLLSGAVAAYAHDRRLYYVETEKERGFLDLHETEQFRMWTNLRDVTGWSSVGLLGIGIGGYIMELKYENRAHQFALDMKVSF